MQKAEELTPTFIIKLIVLFALLLTGVFLRTNKLGEPADARNVQYQEQPATQDNDQQLRQGYYYKVVKTENPDKASI